MGEPADEAKWAEPGIKSDYVPNIEDDLFAVTGDDGRFRKVMTFHMSKQTELLQSLGSTELIDALNKHSHAIALLIKEMREQRATEEEQDPATP